jgi:hypothetical protein
MAATHIDADLRVHPDDPDNVKRLKEAYHAYDTFIRSVHADDLHKKDRELYHNCVNDYFALRKALMLYLRNAQGDIQTAQDTLDNQDLNDEMMRTAMNHIFLVVHHPNTRNRYEQMAIEVSECVNRVCSLGDNLMLLKKTLESKEYSGTRNLNTMVAVVSTCVAVLGVFLLAVPGLQLFGVIAIGSAAAGVITGISGTLAAFGIYGALTGFTQVEFDETKLAGLKEVQQRLTEDTNHIKEALMHHEKVIAAEASAQRLRPVLNQPVIDLDKMRLFCRSFFELWETVATPPTTARSMRSDMGVIGAVGAAALTSGLMMGTSVFASSHAPSIDDTSSR